MQVRVRLFGSVREAAGAKERLVELPAGATAGDLRALLARDHALVRDLGRRLRISVGLEFVGDERCLAEGDEVALLPPVAGGSAAAPSRCRVSSQPLDPGDTVRRVSGPDCGGIVSFVGTVREEARGRRIRYLEYEAHSELAEREMEKIAGEAAARWPGVRVAIDHRAGHLEIGEIAVVVVAAAPHRAEAFAAARFAIEELKQRVPIWKKEVATDGEYWVDDHA